LLKDLSKNPSQPTQNALPVPNEGVSCALRQHELVNSIGHSYKLNAFLFFSQNGTAVTVGEQQQPLAVTDNGHDAPS